MMLSLGVMTLIMLVFGAWLVSHSINVRPWETQPEGSRPDDTAHAGRLAPSLTAARVGLAVFLAVVTALFAITISAYLMRMEMGEDWRPLPTPGLLWLNTAGLALGSLALQWAWKGARKKEKQALRQGLLLGGGFTIVFILGQGVVWWQLHEAGHYLASNPATSFFFFLTALHALHMLGGLAAWARSVSKLRRGASPEEMRASIELCALYWHFLLVIWCILFALVLST